MNIFQMKAFIETAQAASISKAAHHLHLTQPAVSQQLQSLEKYLGHQLLLRSNKGVKLTESGNIFYSYAQSFITLWENLQNDLATVEENHTSLRIGTCAAIGQYALPCALYLFKQKYPQLSVAVQSFSSAQILDQLREHSIQIGFVQDGHDLKAFNSSPVLKSRFVLAAPPTTEVTSLTLTDLPTIPLILGSADSDLKKALQHAFLDYGFDLNVLLPLLELDGIESIKSTVRAGHGYSFLPYFTIKKDLFTKELKEIELKGVDLATSFSMVWKKEMGSTEVEQNFINFIKTEGVKAFC